MARFHREEDEREQPRRDQDGGGTVILLVVVVAAAGLLVLAAVGGLAALWLFMAGAEERVVVVQTEAVAGPGVTRTYDKPVPAAPPADMVRVVAEKVRADATTVHWKWTIVGDRVWSQMEGSTEAVELKDPSPLDNPRRIGSTNAFECELILTTTLGDGGMSGLHFHYSLTQIGTHISDGPKVTGHAGEGGVESGATVWSDAKPLDLTRAVTVRLDGDQALPLPLDAVLVEVAGEAADGTPLRHTFRLKVAD
jgi:hypothetical protein